VFNGNNKNLAAIYDTMGNGKGYTFGSLFAGIGGICIGFSQAGFTLEWANELDKYACQTYRHNMSKINKNLNLSEGDICKFYPPYKVDVLGGGFPCQPYSVAGHMNGLNDKRGLPMFKEIIRIAKNFQPRAIFLENVGNLKTFDDGKTFSILMDHLKEAKYPHIFSAVLNSKDHSGIAQFRNRIYIVAFKDPSDAEAFKKLYGEGLSKVKISSSFYQIVSNSDVPLKYYYSSDDKNKCRSIRYNEHFVPNVTEKGVFYQYRRNKMRANKNGLCPALTASMGAGGHNVPIIIDDYGIRKLMPLECLKAQGFPDWYNFPDDMADCHKYKQVGNSVTVPVIERFANLIHKAFEDADAKQ